MPEFSATVVSLFQKRAAKEQVRSTHAPHPVVLIRQCLSATGRFIERKDPTAGIIVTTASLLAPGLRKMRQPKVIAEALGGILLGAFLLSFRSAQV